MKKFSILLALLACLSASAQSGFDPEITLEQADARLDTAKNVLIGPYSVVAIYPEAEVILNYHSSRVIVTPISSSRAHDSQVIQALVSQTDGMTYRADYGMADWVEIDANTGITVIHQHCKTKILLPKKL